MLSLCAWARGSLAHLDCMQHMPTPQDERCRSQGRMPSNYIHHSIEPSPSYTALPAQVLSPKSPPQRRSPCPTPLPASSIGQAQEALWRVDLRPMVRRKRTPPHQASSAVLIGLGASPHGRLDRPVPNTQRLRKADACMRACTTVSAVRAVTSKMYLP